MALVCKVIKPKRMKQDAMRLELLNVLSTVARGMEKDFKATVATWDHKPKFEVLKSLKGPGPEVLVATDDEVYRYVDEGTGKWGPRKQAYPIPKRGPGWLKFQAGYSAKTVPGVLGSQPGGAYGDSIIMFGEVMHPGIKPRHFDKIIQKKWQKEMLKLALAAMKRAAQKSGHAA